MSPEIPDPEIRVAPPEGEGRGLKIGEALKLLVAYLKKIVNALDIGKGNYPGEWN